MSTSEVVSEKILFDGRAAIRTEIPLTAQGADARLHAWLLLRKLQHHAILNVYDCGTASSNGAAIAYCVHEPSDGNLATALQDGPLHTDEAFELVTSLLRAIEYLHGLGLTCCGIASSEIHASGPHTKLFPARLQQGKMESQQVADLHSLGTLITRAAGVNSPNAIAQAKLRAAAIALVSGRSSATAVLRMLERRVVTGRGLALIGSAAVVITLLALFSWRSQNRVVQKSMVSTPAIDDRPSAIGDSPWKTEPADPVSVRPQAPRQLAARNTDQQRARTDETGDWAVIAATYKSFSAAQRRANSLRADYSDCVCSVYPQDGAGANYYVVVGSNLRRAAADLLRDRAVGSGLPGDTYVTRLGIRPPEPQE